MPCRSLRIPLVAMEFGPQWVELGLLGLFLASFLAATILPFSSEAVLAAMTMGPWTTLALWLVASMGNWLGGMSSYGIGRMGSLVRIAKWLRTDPATAQAWRARIERHGAWAALLCWLPVIGDPIAIALGLGRSRIWSTALLMLLGKALRYAVVLALLR